MVYNESQLTLYSWRSYSQPGQQAISSFYIGTNPRFTTVDTNYTHRGRPQVVPWLCTIFKSP